MCAIRKSVFDTFIGHQLSHYKTHFTLNANFFPLIDVYDYLQYAPIDLQKIMAQGNKFQYTSTKGNLETKGLETHVKSA